MCDNAAIKVIVGNKRDLDLSRRVDAARARAFADLQGLRYFETSALSGEGVDQLFEELGAMLLAAAPQHTDAATASEALAAADAAITAEQPGTPKHGCC